MDAQILAEALRDATALEERARAHWKAHADDVPERDGALVVVRHTTALRRALEQWIAARSMRAELRSR